MNKGDVFEPELQAIQAFCHHAEVHVGCPRCKFRTEAGLEDLTVKIRVAIKSLGGEPG